MARHVGRRSRRRRGRHVVGVGGVEAGDVGEVVALGGDKGDVGAGVEGLVLGAVEVGRVFDLDGGVGAWRDGGAGGGEVVWERDAGVARVDLGDEGCCDGGEVGLGFGVWGRMAAVRWIRNELKMTG